MSCNNFWWATKNVYQNFLNVWQWVTLCQTLPKVSFLKAGTSEARNCMPETKLAYRFLLQKFCLKWFIRFLYFFKHFFPSRNLTEPLLIFHDGFFLVSHLTLESSLRVWSYVKTTFLGPGLCIKWWWKALRR